MKFIRLSKIALLLLSINCFADETEQYKVTVNDVYDGDTFFITWEGLPFNFDRISIRVSGVDTPEIHAKCPNEKDKAIAAKNYVSNLILHKDVVIKNCVADKYFRWNCEVIVDDEYLSKLLIDNGYGISYHGEQKTNAWCLKVVR